MMGGRVSNHGVAFAAAGFLGASNMLFVVIKS
jgi:hypothetical protein